MTIWPQITIIVLLVLKGAGMVHRGVDQNDSKDIVGGIVVPAAWAFLLYMGGFWNVLGGAQ